MITSYSVALTSRTSGCSTMSPHCPTTLPSCRCRSPLRLGVATLLPGSTQASSTILLLDRRNIRNTTPWLASLEVCMPNSTRRVSCLHRHQWNWRYSRNLQLLQSDLEWCTTRIKWKTKVSYIGYTRLNAFINAALRFLLAHVLNSSRTYKDVQCVRTRIIDYCLSFIYIY